MRVFNSFLTLVVVALLWMLPMSQAIYDYRTDVRDDEFTVTTAVAVSTGTATLVKPVYDDDYQTISILSDLSTDNVTFVSYNTTTRLVSIAQLTPDSDRSLTISYDVDALTNNTALNLFLNIIPFIWILILSIFPLIALFMTWRRQ